MRRGLLHDRPVSAGHARRAARLRVHTERNGQHRNPLRNQRLGRVRRGRRIARRSVRRRRRRRRREGGGGDQSGAAAPGAPPMSRLRAHRAAADERQTGSAPNEPAAFKAPTDVRSVTLTVLAVIATIVMLRYAQAVIIPIVLGVLISYALEPIVARLTRLRVARGLAAA